MPTPPSPMHSLSRRRFLHSSTFGVGSVALAYLLHQEQLLAEPVKPDLDPRHFDLKPKAPHHPPKAKAMISLFMQGGPSHVDLLDPKPKLTELDGKPFPATSSTTTPQKPVPRCSVVRGSSASTDKAVPRCPNCFRISPASLMMCVWCGRCTPM